MRAVIIFQQYPNYLLYLKPKTRDNPKKMRDSTHKRDLRNALDSVVKFFNHYKKKR